MACWPTSDPGLISFWDVAYVAPIFGNTDTVTYQFHCTLNILFTCAPVSIFPRKNMVAPRSFLYAYYWLDFCNVHVLYQVVHDHNVCGHIFSTLEIYLSGAYYWYRCIDIVFNYESSRTTFVLCLLPKHWSHTLHWHWHCLLRCMYFAIFECVLVTRIITVLGRSICEDTNFSEAGGGVRYRDWNCWN